MTEPPFTDEEIIALREFVTHKDEFAQMMALRGARKLLFQTYRSWIIGLAGLVVAITTFGEHMKAWARAFLLGGH